MTKFQEYARKNFTPMSAIDEMWHPEIQAECRIMNDEETARREKEAADAEAKRLADRARIKEVVEKTADISAELAGRIVVKVSFEGSHAKKKRLTAAEARLVMSLPADVKAAIGGEKPLFECAAYDELMGFITTRRDEFATYGIPHVKFQSAHVVDITRIPEIDELAAKTETELAVKVAAFLEAWPAAIEEAKGSLGQLFNPQDYRAAEAMKNFFRFDYDWMAFGVPDELKQFDERIYAKAKAKAEKAWKEIESNGVLLLRQSISDLVAGLVESLTPKENGEKRKFYSSSVTKIVDFIETFRRRNICKDIELDAEVTKLEALVSGIDIKAMSSDVKLRESVKRDMVSAGTTLSELVTDAKLRIIDLE